MGERQCFMENLKYWINWLKSWFWLFTWRLDPKICCVDICHKVLSFCYDYVHGFSMMSPLLKNFMMKVIQPSIVCRVACKNNTRTLLALTVAIETPLEPHLPSTSKLHDRLCTVLWYHVLWPQSESCSGLGHSCAVEVDHILATLSTKIFNY